MGAFDSTQPGVPDARPKLKTGGILGSRSDDAGSSARNTYGLTPGQMSVLGLLAKGLDREQIAVKMGVSIHTVNSHLEHAFHKLKVHCAAAAVAEKIVPYSSDDDPHSGDQ